MRPLIVTLTLLASTFLTGCGALQSREIEEISLIIAGSNLMRNILPDQTPVAIECTQVLDATELQAQAMCVISYADSSTYDLYCQVQPEIECAAIRRHLPSLE